MCIALLTPETARFSTRVFAFPPLSLRRRGWTFCIYRGNSCRIRGVSSLLLRLAWSSLGESQGRDDVPHQPRSRTAAPCSRTHCVRPVEMPWRVPRCLGPSPETRSAPGARAWLAPGRLQEVGAGWVGCRGGLSAVGGAGVPRKGCCKVHPRRCPGAWCPPGPRLLPLEPTAVFHSNLFMPSFLQRFLWTWSTHMEDIIFLGSNWSLNYFFTMFREFGCECWGGDGG